jgi:hypothetical protein
MRERKADIAYVQVRMPLALHQAFAAIAEARSHSVPKELLEIAKAWVNVSERDRRAFFLKAAEGHAS